jgi:hypothetical protein
LEYSINIIKKGAETNAIARGNQPSEDPEVGAQYFDGPVQAEPLHEIDPDISRTVSEPVTIPPGQVTHGEVYQAQSHKIII